MLQTVTEMNCNSILISVYRLLKRCTYNTSQVGTKEQTMKAGKVKDLEARSNLYKKVYKKNTFTRKVLNGHRPKAVYFPPFGDLHL